MQNLARAGATLTGRLIGLDGDRVRFDSSLASTIAAADAYAARIRVVLDEALRRAGLNAPNDAPDPADRPVPLDPPLSLDLRDHDVTSVIWATGYAGDFTWLAPGLTGTRGEPVRDGAAARLPGLWYIGLRWLTRRSSGNFLGFPTDAATIADAVTTALAGRLVAATPPGRTRVSP